MGEKPLTILGLYKEFIMKNKKVIVLYTAFLLVTLIRDVGVPHILGETVKAIEKKTNLLVPVGKLFGIMVLIQISFSCIDYFEVDILPKFNAFVRGKIINKVIAQSNSDFSELESGKIISRILRLPSALYHFLASWKFTFIPYIVLSITAVVYFTWENITLGALLFTLIVFCWVMIYLSVKLCYKHAYQSESDIISITEQVDDVLRNMTTILSSNQEEEEVDAVQKYETDYRTHVRDTLICSLKMRFMTAPLSIIYFIIFIAICYNAVKRKEMDPGTFVALVLIMFKIFNIIWDLTGYMNDAIGRWGMLTKSFEFLRESKIQKLNPTKIVPPMSSSGFVFRDVTYAYTNDNNQKKVLSHFNLHIPKHQKLVVMGTIGSGKSTLLKLMLKQLTCQSGDIYYQGVSYRRMQTSDIRRLIGYIQQQPVLFNRSIYDNITYGLKNTSPNDVNALIKSLKLQTMFADFPKGLHTKAGKNGSNLSGGQRQLVIILRVILQNPPVILMDEPTASIDANTKKIIYDLLVVLMKNRTVVMVTHDQFLVQYADRTISFDGGNIVNDSLKQSR